MDEARHDLADRALAADAEQQRIGEERVLLDDDRVVVERVQFGDLDLLMLLWKNIREVPHREPHRDVAAGRRLGELIDVAEVRL